MWYRNIILAEKHTSVIVALWLPENKSKKLSLSESELPENSKPEPVSNLHITLLYIGKADALKDKRKLIEAALETIASKYSTIKGMVQGVGCFSGDGETKPFYASYDSPELPEIRQELVSVIESLGVELDKTHGFTPHITLAYLEKDAELPNVNIPDVPIDFDGFTLAWAGEKKHYSFSQKLGAVHSIISGSGSS